MEESLPIRRGLRGWLLRWGPGGEQGRGLRSVEGGGGGGGGPGGCGGTARWWMEAAGGCGDGCGDGGGGPNRISVFPMVQLGVPPLGGEGARGGDLDVGGGGVGDATGGGGDPTGAGLLHCRGRQPVEEGDPGDLGLDGLLEGQEVEEAAQGDGGGEAGGEGGDVGKGCRGEDGLVEGGGPGAPVDEGAHAGGVGEPRGVVVGGEEGDLLFGELLGEGKPPEEEAGLKGGAGHADGEDVHIRWHVARGDEEAWGLLQV